MHFDFEALLLILAVVSGLIWLVDSLFLARSRQQPATSKTSGEPILVEYAKAFFPVLFAVLLLRAFLFEPFRIPSGSMMPSLLVGDFIVVNKFSYGFRAPVWHTRITEGDRPAKGDVIVFRYPEDETQDYIKRVIGLPGDEISYYNRRVLVNGVPLEIESDRVYQGLAELNGMVGGGGCDNRGAQCEVFVEHQGDASYNIMVNPNAYSIGGKFSVPADHYFVMGDNRDHSNDSRIWGFVPEENLVGKATRVWLHWDFREDGTGFDLSRIGLKISN
ncbi:MAG: signal peptidase I [Pseudomonadota bacterium]